MPGEIAADRPSTRLESQRRNLLRRLAEVEAKLVALRRQIGSIDNSSTKPVNSEGCYYRPLFYKDMAAGCDINKAIKTNYLIFLEHANRHPCRDAQRGRMGLNTDRSST